FDLRGAPVEEPAVFDQDATVADGEPEEPEPARAVQRRARTPKVTVAEPTESGSVGTEQLEIELGPGVKGSPWRLPPTSLLRRSDAREVDRAAVEQAGRTLEQALAQHGVDTRLVGMVVGPSVTRFELELAPGVKVSRVTSLHKDIAYAM